MSTLDPDQRTLYVDFLRPPPGWQLDVGVALTYSVDLDTLLSVPLHLALHSAETDQASLLQDGVAILDALRRTSSRFLVFCERGRIRAPRQQREIYSLLEPVLQEVPRPAAGRGSFHPKLWLLRYEPSTEGREPFYRAVVLSRNLASDLSWDLSITLEGWIGEDPTPENEPLRGLVGPLVQDALESPNTSDLDEDAFQRLLEELTRVRWAPPEPFKDLTFHVLGPGAAPWRPAPSERLAVLSPFCTDQALAELCDTTAQPVLLVSRLSELAKLDPRTRDRFQSVFTIHEAATTGDGEEAEQTTEREDAARDLHAKIYVAEDPEHVRLYAGSANATSAALIHSNNAEILLELRAPQSEVGVIESILDDEGLRGILSPASEDVLENAPTEDSTAQELEDLRRALTTARWGGHCERDAEDEDSWTVEVRLSEMDQWSKHVEVRVWPVTRSAHYGLVMEASEPPGRVRFQSLLTSELTTLFAMELRSTDAPEGAGSERFVLGIRLDDFPSAEQDAALKRQLLRDPDSFIRYLLMLLSGGEDHGFEGLLGKLRNARGQYSDSLDDLPLLESLVRTYCREPSRLNEVRDLIEDLRSEEAGDEEIVPDGFMELWRVFEERLEQV